MVCIKKFTKTTFNYKTPLNLTQGVIKKKEVFYFETTDGYCEYSEFPHLIENRTFDDFYKLKNINISLEQNRIPYNSTSVKSHKVIFENEKVKSGICKIKITIDDLLVKKLNNFEINNPDIKYRLDFNNKCSLNQFQIFEKDLKKLRNLLYIEDPLIEHEDLFNFYKNASIPLALDFDLQKMRTKDVLSLKDTTFIIKPRLFFNFNELELFINKLNQKDIKWVLSNIFDSPWLDTWYQSLVHYFSNSKETHGIYYSHLFKEEINRWPLKPTVNSSWQ